MGITLGQGEARRECTPPSGAAVTVTDGPFVKAQNRELCSWPGVVLAMSGDADCIQVALAKVVLARFGDAGGMQIRMIRRAAFSRCALAPSGIPRRHARPGSRRPVHPEHPAAPPDPADPARTRRQIHDNPAGRQRELPRSARCPSTAASSSPTSPTSTPPATTWRSTLSGAASPAPSCPGTASKAVQTSRTSPYPRTAPPRSPSSATTPTSAASGQHPSSTPPTWQRHRQPAPNP